MFNRVNKKGILLIINFHENYKIYIKTCIQIANGNNLNGTFLIELDNGETSFKVDYTHPGNPILKINPTVSGSILLERKEQNDQVWIVEAKDQQNVDISG